MLPPRRCIFCGGTGFKETTNYYGNSERIYCPDCNGTGYLNDSFNTNINFKPRCISCGGRGFVETTDYFGNPERLYCTDCNGTGYLKY